MIRLRQPLAAVLLITTLPWVSDRLHGAELCPADIVERACAPADPKESEILLSCSLDFQQFGCNDLDLPNTLTKRLILEGSAATDLVLDLSGAHLDGGKGQFNHGRGDMIEVRSRLLSDGSWDAPGNVQIRNARITGSIRIFGMGKNGEADAIKIASVEDDGQQQIRDAAPYQITLDSLTISGTGRNPIYFGPGVQKSSLLNSTVTGYSTRVAVYLDAESSHNTISGNTFDVKTNDGSWIGFYDRGWPQLALDSSSYNVISNNTFERLNQGGIFLYRNCGEGGTVRIATPSHNRIVDNQFNYQRQRLSDPAIYLGSRNYGRLENWWPGSHCNDDARGSRVGSALNNGDFARFNVVKNNRFDISKLNKQSPEDGVVTIDQLIRVGNARRDHSNDIADNDIADNDIAD